MSEGAGPFSMLSVSALENHIKSVTFAGKEYAAMEWGGDAGTTLTQLMIFCRGTLRYNDQQQVVLLGGPEGTKRVEPGDWIIMLSRSAYAVMRPSESASLFSLMPNVALSTPEERLARIADAHSQEKVNGMTSGLCVECYQRWDEEAGGCPTRVWATKDRDPLLSTWDPADDETPADTASEEGVEDGGTE